MENHKFRGKDDVSPGETPDPVGNEGSNVIYLGKSARGQYLFLHMDGGDVETLTQLRYTVRGYSADARGDSNILNYKFKERYSPAVPPFISE
jgi:hypothetical protein